MPSPILVTSIRTMKLSPEELGREILRLENWKNFQGYGPLPGIQEATFRKKTDELIGTQIAVQNKDGSGHIEEIIEWLPGDITLEMKEFSAPLSGLATHFIERWTFTKVKDGFEVRRGFLLHPKNMAGVLALRLIAPLMKRAVDRHLAQMAAA